MAKKAEYERVAGGSYGVYRQKKKGSGWGAVAAFFLVLFLLIGLFG